MTMWTYNGKLFTEEMIGDAYGFVYLITNTLTGKSYYGKKFFTKAKTLRRKKRNKKLRVQSDWQTYWGSNDQLVADIAQLGEDHFTREILRLCASRGECSYWENYYIFTSHALLSSTYYNQWTSCKVHRSHLKNLTQQVKDGIILLS
jgi:hypothetical protein